MFSLKASKGGRGNPSPAALPRRTRTPGRQTPCGTPGLRGPQAAGLLPRPPPALGPGETCIAQPHTQGDRGYPHASLQPLTLGIPPASVAERRYLSIPAGGRVRFRQGRSRRSPGGRARRARAPETRRPALRPSSPGAAPAPRPSGSQSPAKLLGDHLSKPWEFRAKPPPFLNLSTGMSSREDKRGGCLALRNVGSTDTQSSSNARPALAPRCLRPRAPHSITSARQLSPGLRARRPGGCAQERASLKWSERGPCAWPAGRPRSGLREENGERRGVNSGRGGPFSSRTALRGSWGGSFPPVVRHLLSSLPRSAARGVLPCSPQRARCGSGRGAAAPCPRRRHRGSRRAQPRTCGWSGAAGLRGAAGRQVSSM